MISFAKNVTKILIKYVIYIVLRIDCMNLDGLQDGFH